MFKTLASTSLLLLLLLLLLVLLFSFSVSIRAVDSELGCNCDRQGFWSNENILKRQKVCDFLIAVAYFCIPIELLYFVSCSNIPYKRVLILFIPFIVLCGMTHLLNVWTYSPHTVQLMLALTIFKGLTALVSFATALALFTLIPLLLKVMGRKTILEEKTWDLGREVGIIKKQKEAGLHHETCRYLDRHTILFTTLVQLSKTLDLENCAVWMPNADRTEMNLLHDLKEHNKFYKLAIPSSEADMREIKGSVQVKILDSESPLAVASSRGIGEPRSVAAIRMPMLRVSNFKGGTPEMVPASYAILVLVLPAGQGRRWRRQELEIVEVAADQVAVAISHAAVLEESQLMRDKLVEQNRALEQAKQDALMASQSRNAFQMVMSNGLRSPMHSILGLLSVLQDEHLSEEQRLLVDTTFKTGNVLSTLINDVVDTSGKDRNRRFPLEMRPFQLHSMIKEAACLSKCLCALRGYKFLVEVDKSMPNDVRGDERRAFQVILHMVGNLLKANRGGGFLLLRVYSESRSQVWIEQRRSWRSNSSDGYAYIRLGAGISHSDSHADNTVPVSPYGGQRCCGEESMSFSICNKLVQLMQGDIRMISNPEGFDQSVGLELQFQALPSIVQGLLENEQSPKSMQWDSLFRGMEILLADADNANRAVTRKLLEKLGCVVSAVSSGYECLNALGPSASSFQAVLLDFHLPDLDGFDVARKIRKFPSRKWLLIAALTANDDGETKDKCLQVGMNGVIGKPCSFQRIAYELEGIVMQANRLKW